MLKLMYITNNPDVARIAQDAGAERIMVDMEYIGKELRQGGLDSVKNHHTVEDVRNIRAFLITTIYRSFETADNWFSAKVQYDMANK